MVKGNTGIIVVDMQDSFVKNLEEKDLARLEQAYGTLLEYATKKGIPIYNCVAPEYGNTIKLIKKYQKIPTFNKTKKANDCFTAKNFLETLTENETDNLIITGVKGSSCVKYTSHSALDKGFNIFSSEDLVASPKEESSEHEEFMSWFYRESGEQFYDDVRELIEHLEN